VAMVVRTISKETPYTLTPYNQTLQSDNLTAARNVAMLTTHAAVKSPMSWALCAAMLDRK